MNKIQQSFIREAQHPSAVKLLNLYENNLISSLAAKPPEYVLSDKQNKVLNSIHNKVYNAVNQFYMRPKKDCNAPRE